MRGSGKRRYVCWHEERTEEEIGQTADSSEKRGVKWLCWLFFVCVFFSSFVHQRRKEIERGPRAHNKTCVGFSLPPLCRLNFLVCLIAFFEVMFMSTFILSLSVLSLSLSLVPPSCVCRRSRRTLTIFRSCVGRSWRFYLGGAIRSGLYDRPWKDVCRV